MRTTNALLAVTIALLGACGDRASDPVPVAERLTEALAADGRYISWLEHIIDDENTAGGVKLRGADGLAMADLDGDGQLV